MMCERRSLELEQQPKQRYSHGAKRNVEEHRVKTSAIEYRNERVTQVEIFVGLADRELFFELLFSICAICRDMRVHFYSCNQIHKARSTHRARGANGVLRSPWVFLIGLSDTNSGDIKERDEMKRATLVGAKDAAMHSHSETVYTPFGFYLSLFRIFPEIRCNRLPIDPCFNKKLARGKYRKEFIARSRS